MNKNDIFWQSWGLLFTRLILGLIFFMAGIFKIFELGATQHAIKFFLPYKDTFLPIWSLWIVGVTIPFVELIAGVMVFIGFKTKFASASLGIVLVIVTFGHLLKAPLYPFNEHVIPRLLLVLIILLSPGSKDKFSVDYFLNRK